MNKYLNYNFKKIDKKWNFFFKKKKIYNYKKKYYILNMFPYPSGEGLHIGHTLGYLISDVIIRYKKMLNYNIFNPIGFDSFGLPTEYYSNNINKHPLKVTKLNIKNFKKQLKKLSILFNWENILYTSNIKYYKWTQWIFIKLYNSWYNYKSNKAESIKKLINIFKKKKKKWYIYNNKKKNKILNKYRLIYIKKTHINWCEKLKTVLSNEEIYKNKSIRGGYKIIKKKKKQWHIRITPYFNRLLKSLKKINYPKHIKKIQKKWIGKNKWIKIKNIKIFYKKKKKFKINVYINNYKIFLLYSTCLIISNKYKNIKLFNKIKKINFKKNIYKTYKTKYEALHPTNKNYIPIYISNYINYKYNINVLIINPFNKKNNIFLKKNNILFFKIKKNFFKKKKNRKKFINKYTLYKKNIYNMRDIILSRQKYWGEPIPIYYKNNIPINIKINNLPLILPNIKKIKSLSKINKWAYNIKKKKIVNNKFINNKNIFKLDNNIMSSWAGSNWYFFRYLDVNNSTKIFSKKKINKWFPINLYIGGAEHVTGHLIYCRFLTKFFYDINLISFKEPFKKYINQGMILHNSYIIYKNDKKKYIISYNIINKNINYEQIYINIKFIKKKNILNIKKFIKYNSIYNKYKFIYKKKFICKNKLEKMSKSKLNVINPNKIINQYGTDVYRMYILFLGPYNKNKIWNNSKIKGIYYFLKKIWFFFNKNKKKIKIKKYKKNEKYFINKNIFKIITNIKKYNFNISISYIMIFFKKIIKNNITNKKTLKKFLILLSLFSPNISEEIWNKIMKYKKKIIYNKIPFYKKKYFFNKKYKYIFLINSKFKKKFIFIQKINIFSNKIKKYKNIKKILLIKKKKIINLII